MMHMTRLRGVPRLALLAAVWVSSASMLYAHIVRST